MRKFSAHRIYPVNQPPVPFGIIETDDDGTILRVRDTGGKPVEEAGLEFYPGIIIPGLVNTHCHLELSHLAGLIPELSGISGFVSAVSNIRQADSEKILSAAILSDRIMYKQGISAVGDISNTGITLSIKQKSHIRYHTFIELFGLNSDIASARFGQALSLSNEFRAAGLPCSISPHAPYSVGIDLWKLISETDATKGRISIHHDESLEERELLESRSGPMADSFRQSGFDLTSIPADASDIFRLLQKHVPESDWILVHNTVTDPVKMMADQIRMPADLLQVIDDPTMMISRPDPSIYWVLCPGSNEYIEGKLPDIKRFAESGFTICLGTDSLASNHSLSVTDEMKNIQNTAPGLPFQTVLKWATINGANALGMGKELGTIETGKNPGLVNIPVFDWELDRLTEKSSPVRLI